MLRDKHQHQVLMIGFIFPLSKTSDKTIMKSIYSIVFHLIIHKAKTYLETPLNMKLQDMFLGQE